MVHAASSYISALVRGDSDMEVQHIILTNTARNKIFRKMAGKHLWTY
jgi:hypothetical protein